MAHLLGAEGLRLEFPTRVVFDAVTLGINDGDRIGIVGRSPTRSTMPTPSVMRSSGT